MRRNDSRIDGGLLRAFGHLLTRYIFLVAPVAGVTFTLLYGRPTPITDEWRLVQYFMDFLGGELDLRHFHPLITQHDLRVPVAYYFLTADAVNLDSRFYMLTTQACFLVILLLFRKYLTKHGMVLLPVAMILWSPSHYFEMLWGFQYTIAFSIVFPLIALGLLSEVSLALAWGRHLLILCLAALLFLLGICSSAGGLIGLIAAVFLLTARLFSSGWSSRRVKLGNLLVLILCMVSFAWAYSGMSPHGVKSVRSGVQHLAYLTTAIGGGIIGLEESRFEFAFSIASLLGAIVLLLGAYVCAAALRVKNSAPLLLMLSYCAYGTVAILAVSSSRSYLGVWHLQLVIPGIVGLFGASYLVWDQRRTVLSKVVFFSMYAILLCSCRAYYSGFGEWGPQFQRSTEQIERYIAGYLKHPEKRKPYPKPYLMDMNADMARFLAARKHPLFDAQLRIIEAGLANRRHVAKSFSVYALSDAARFEREFIEVRDSNRHIPVEGFFDGPVGAVALRIDDSLFPMQETSPTLRVLSGPGTPFSGMIVAGGLAPGRHPYQLVVASDKDNCLQPTELVHVEIRNENVELDPKRWFSPERQASLSVQEECVVARGAGHFGVLLRRSPELVLFRFEALVHCDSGPYSLGIKFFDSRKREIANAFQGYRDQKEPNASLLRISGTAPENTKFVMPYVFALDDTSQTTIERARLQAAGRRRPTGN